MASPDYSSWMGQARAQPLARVPGWWVSANRSIFNLQFVIKRQSISERRPTTHNICSIHPTNYKRTNNPG